MGHFEKLTFFEKKKDGNISYAHVLKMEVLNLLQLQIKVKAYSMQFSIVFWYFTRFSDPC